MKVTLISAILLFLASFASAQRAKSVLLPASEAKLFAKQCSRWSPSDFTDTWEPTKEQITKMEAKLGDISRLKAKKCCIRGDSVKNPNDWYLQYAGLVWKGKKIIYVGGISIEEPLGPCIDKDMVITSMTGCSAWKERAYIVCDGGVTWGVIYDIKNGKFSDLAVDGIG